MSRPYCCGNKDQVVSEQNTLRSSPLPRLRRRTYGLVVVLEGDVRVSSLERVVGRVIPGDVINPVGLVVVPGDGDWIRVNVSMVNMTRTVWRVVG